MRKFNFESLKADPDVPSRDADGSGPAVVEEEPRFDLTEMLNVLAQQVKRGSAATRLAVLRWILHLHRAMTIRL